jgi:hypothetical protein
MSFPFRTATLLDLQDERRQLHGLFDAVHRALFFSAIRDIAGKISWEVVADLDELRDQWNAVAQLETSLEPAREGLSPMARVEWQILRDEQLELLVAAHNLAVEARASFAEGKSKLACEVCLRKFQRLERLMFAHQSRRDYLRTTRG